LADGNDAYGSLKAGLAVLLPCSCSLVQADITGRVVAVTDGDTIKVLDSDNTQHKVRLTGIDAPEMGQPFGTASTKHLVSLVSVLCKGAVTGRSR
jgi:endonuclease YncB( thermonuclease family)